MNLRDLVLASAVVAAGAVGYDSCRNNASYSPISTIGKTIDTFTGANYNPHPSCESSCESVPGALVMAVPISLFILYRNRKRGKK